jgi:hypothetical protein
MDEQHVITTEGNHKAWHSVHIYHPPQYHTKDSKIGIQDHKAIMNMVASLPWFIHKHDIGTKHATRIQVSTRRKGKHTIMCESLCGSRTGGWSLPDVMSDWQCCVYWLLAMYCSCRLRLDWWWCRWRTSGHCLCEDRLGEPKRGRGVNGSR